jgi:hydroxymethylbilane synthase
MMNRKTLKIGTRGSPLALRQSTWVKEALSKAHPGLLFDLEIIKTTGDKIGDVPLAAIGGKGLFVKEIEEALLDRRIDLAVHSMKDMPGDIPEGLMIGAVPLREDPRDVLISRDNVLLTALGQGVKIGTGSLRRKAQLLHQRPDLEIIALRGNLDTRIRKIESEGLAGIILAAAGIHRMGLNNRISQYLDLEISLPAVGQGALALEIRLGEPWLQEIVRFIHHEESSLCTQAERAFLHRLQGGCQIPIAGHAWIQKRQICLKGLIADLDGHSLFKDQIEGPLDDPLTLGVSLAERLLKTGGKNVLDQFR